MLALIAALPQYIVRILSLATFVGFVGSSIMFSLDALSWYVSAVAFWHNYVVEPADGLAAWVPIDVIQQMVTWWFGFFIIMFGIRVARLVFSWIAGTGD